MEILCNGAKHTVAGPTTVHRFIIDSGLNPDFVVAECDGRILEKEEYPEVTLQEGSVLELVRFVGGG